MKKNALGEKAEEENKRKMESILLLQIKRN